MNIIEKCKKKIEAFLKKIDWEKVILNITLTAIIPILLFTAPVTTEKFCWDNWGGIFMKNCNKESCLVQ